MKTYFLRRLKREMLKSFLRSKLIGTPCTIFRRYYRGIFMSVAMENPYRLPIFCTPSNEPCLNPDVFINFEWLKIIDGKISWDRV